MIKIGHGFDVHAFGQDRPLVIGGVVVPYHTGFIAHSDGDVALHALTDSILGAAALGDIGKLFPDTNMQFKDIDSRILLREAFRQVQEKGYKIGNVDISIKRNLQRYAEKQSQEHTIPRMESREDIIKMAESYNDTLNEISQQGIKVIEFSELSAFI